MFVLPERSSPITIPTRRTGCFYVDTGPTPVKAASSNIAVPLAKSGGSCDGSTSTFLKPCNVGSMSIKMRQRRETVEHPFGTIKARMGATHFLMKTLPRVASEMALHVLAYNLTRVMNIVGIHPMMAASGHRAVSQRWHGAPKSKRFDTTKTQMRTSCLAHGIDPKRGLCEYRRSYI